MTGRVKLIIGVLSLLIAAVIVVVAYSNLPSASACQAINNAQQQLGQAATCHSSPSPGVWIAAGIFGGIGVLFLATSSRGKE